MAEEKSDLKLAKIDCSVEENVELCDKYSAEGYPTLKFFRDDLKTDYRGGREPEQIVDWLKKKSGPLAKELKTDEEFRKFLKDNEVGVVGFFKDLDSKEVGILKETAFLVDEYPFAVTTNEKLCEKYETKCGNVALFKKFDEGKNVFEGELTVENLRKFALKNGLPLVVEYTADIAAKLFSGYIKSHFVLFISKRSEGYEKLLASLKTIAEKFRGDLIFIVINTDYEAFLDIGSFFGVKETDIPAIRISKSDSEIVKYKFDKKDMTPELIEEFVQSYVDGKLEEYYLSQDLPKDWNKGLVKILVASNFDEIAFDKNKHVFVDFYAPWCNYCKEFEPIFEQLGEKFKDSDTVVIAKVDATLNQFKHSKIKKYPTLYLYRKEDNHIIDYNGERTFEAMYKFLGGTDDEEVKEETCGDSETCSEKPAEKDEL